ncbi:hypothetical protein BC940DRAFT_364572 [Gongronella butleri]|nr:hypothetical protein BC940DRAFT_364572 [Gongronella butleri]
MELVLGSFNGVMIQGKRPRRPKMRKVLGGRAPLVLKPPDSPTSPFGATTSTSASTNNTATAPSNGVYAPRPSDTDHAFSISPIQLYAPDQAPTQGAYSSSALTCRTSPPPPTSEAMLQVLLQVLQSNSNGRWSVEPLDGQQGHNYRLHLHSLQDMDELLHVLRQFAFCASSPTMMADPSPTMMPPSLFMFDDDHVDRDRGVVRWKPVRLPFLRYHSELYPKMADAPLTDWPPFSSVLPLLLDDCVHTFITCMNHYFTVFPKQKLVHWYSSLADPTTDALVLSIATFWVRHVFIHHPMPQLKNLNDPAVLDAVQFKLSRLARDALAECFDEPHVHTIYALCLCNMTTVISLEQKVTNHMLAVRMASALNIQPVQKKRKHDPSMPSSSMAPDAHDDPDRDDNDHGDTELKSRLWWFLFQIDLFLLESRAISVSMVQPASDDYDSLAHLRRPMPFSLDAPDEVPGVHVWNNVLKIWLIRRRLAQQLDTIDQDDEPRLTQLYDHGMAAIDQWQSELPAILQSNSPPSSSYPSRQDHTNDMDGSKLAEATLTIHMERCTDIGLLSLRLLPKNGQVLTTLQRRAVMTMIDSATQDITIRQSVVSFAPCQTWPGSLLRSIKMLMSCLHFGDPAVISRSRIGLMRAARMLRSMAEVRWKDPICTSMLNKIERVLANETISEMLASLDEVDDDDDDDDDFDNDNDAATTSTASPTNLPATSHSIPPQNSTTAPSSYRYSVSSQHSAASSSNTPRSNSAQHQHQQPPPPSPPPHQANPPSNHTAASGASSSRFIPVHGPEKRSIKMSNHLYEGVVLLDRDMQPRAQYYNPNVNTHDSFDDLLLFEDGARFAKNQS